MAELSTRQTLALRYRPRKLSQMVGQGAAVDVIQGMLKKETAPNAFMFTGPPGTGKTTLSRIVCQSFNCDTLDACGKCESCVSMEKESHRDYLEVNGSDCGVDRARELLDIAKFRPVHNLRVIVIDEVHQTTRAAINILLKNMEEPPPCMLWILSTNEPNRIPNAQAVVSRCIRLQTNLVPARTLAPHVYKVGRRERMKWMTKAAAKAVASASNGYVRDAMQIIETVDAQAGAGTDITKLVSDAGLAVGADESKLALQALVGCYSHEPARVARSILSVQDHHAFINRLLALNFYLLMSKLVGKHDNLWSDRYGRGLVKAVKDRAPKTSTGEMSQLHSVLERCRAEAAMLTLWDAKHLLSARLIEYATA